MVDVRAEDPVEGECSIGGFSARLDGDRVLVADAESGSRRRGGGVADALPVILLGLSFGVGAKPNANVDDVSLTEFIRAESSFEIG